MKHVVLLSGGSGTRLWPLSNDSRSKQFLKVLRDEDGRPVSMVQRAVSQIHKSLPSADLTIATGASQVSPLSLQVEGSYALVVEPERRDTAPAIMLACAHLRYEQGASLDDTVVVLPIDSYVDDEYFERMMSLDHAVQQGFADLVLLGINPTYPSSKYGYIVPEGALSDEVSEVSRFVEKPTEEEASRLISEGALWNGGAFSFKLGYMLKKLDEYISVDSYKATLDMYTKLPKNSFDYEVVEKAKSIAVIPYDGQWKDLGTWNTLSEEMADFCGGRVVGIDSCKNTHVVNELNLPLVTLGLNNVVVVATPDGILVSDKHQSSYMKGYVEQTKATRPMYESRQWGEYRVLDSGLYENDQKSLTKELVVKANKQLSYQKHQCRAEVWTVISGYGEVVLDNETQPVSVGSVIEIPPGCMHSVRAFEDMHVIEVQIGDLLNEEDIERANDYWN